MKYLISILLLLILLQSCKEQANNEIQLKNKLDKFTSTKEWIKAEFILDSLITEYDKSPSIEKYYEAMEFVLAEQIWEIRQKNKTSPDTTVPVGSLTMWLSLNSNKELKSLLNKQINLVQSYFNKFPNGELTNKFYSVLISAYSSIGNHKKVIQISSKLFESNYLDLKIKGAFQLGNYAHAKGDFNKAIKMYKYILNNLESTNTKIQYNYYIADCYFELRDYPNSLNHLQNVFLLSKESTNKDYEKIGEIMFEYINKIVDKNVTPSRHFIYFKDPANEQTNS